MVAFVFPGQGSQSVGMLNAFADHPVAQSVLKRASDALGQDLIKLIAEGPAEQLNLTSNTQPVMLAANIAVYEAWLAEGGQAPKMVAGHSLGEYAALVAAQALKLEDAVKLVRIRADAMQTAVPVGVGGMAAILGLDDATVQQVCADAQQQTKQVVEAVNYNAPAQVVIAGHKEAVERACDLAKDAGAKRALVLPVSAPFHSSLMQPAAEVLKQALAKVDINSPVIPVINNVDVKIETNVDHIKDALVRQAWHPVRWVETIQFMANQSILTVVECGPGKVLAGLNKRIHGDVVSYNIADPESIQSVIAALK